MAVAAGRPTFVRIAFNPRRAALLGWIPLVLGFTPDRRTQDSGLLAIVPVGAPTAARELVGKTRDPECR